MCFESELSDLEQREAKNQEWFAQQKTNKPTQPNPSVVLDSDIDAKPFMFDERNPFFHGFKNSNGEPINLQIEPDDRLKIDPDEMQELLNMVE